MGRKKEYKHIDLKIKTTRLKIFEILYILEKWSNFLNLVKFKANCYVIVLRLRLTVLCVTIRCELQCLTGPKNVLVYLWHPSPSEIIRQKCDRMKFEGHKNFTL